MQTNKPDNLDMFGYTPEETLSVEQLQNQLQQPSKSGVTAASKKTKTQQSSNSLVTVVTVVTPAMTGLLAVTKLKKNWLQWLHLNQSKLKHSSLAKVV